MCAARGLKRRRVVSSTSYGHSADRWYGEERARSELLVLNRQRKTVAGAQPPRDEYGRLLVSVQPNWSFGSILPNRIVVSDELRRLFEGAAFIGLCFGEVAVKGQPVRVPGSSYWELQSSIVLPKMANVHQFVHLGVREPEPFSGDYSRIIMLHDPPFNKGEVHYRRTDIAATGPFDIANTYEKFMEPHPALVISQRFYQHCLADKISIEADPVRIDSD
jgi:hypothetical protein